MIENKLFFYERFIELCSRLLEIQKIKKIQDKVVISFGGKVSSGKSKFINSISGIGQKLPVDQKTTTAIPTYIIKSKSNSVHAVTTDGYSTEISLNGLEAMAHEFNDTYGIGFPAFVDSIIIESNEYTLSNKIALLVIRFAIKSIAFSSSAIYIFFSMTTSLKDSSKSKSSSVLSKGIIHPPHYVDKKY